MSFELESHILSVATPKSIAKSVVMFAVKLWTTRRVRLHPSTPCVVSEDWISRTQYACLWRSGTRSRGCILLLFSVRLRGLVGTNCILVTFDLRGRQVSARECSQVCRVFKEHRTFCHEYFPITSLTTKYQKKIITTVIAHQGKYSTAKPKFEMKHMKQLIKQSAQCAIQKP